MRLGGLKLTVDVDRKPLKEFDFKSEEIEGRKQAKCFIASETGKSFEIAVGNDTDATLAYDMYVDGRVAKRSYVRTRTTSVVNGIHTDENALRPFLFGCLAITDDDAFLNDPKVSLANLGTIRVDMYRANITKKYENRSYPKATDLPAVHERSKKAGGHCVLFGDPIQVKNTGTVEAEYIDKYPESPYARFIFTYRSQEMLQAQGIALAPEPVPNSGVDQSQPSPDEAGPPAAGSKRPNDADVDVRNVKVKTEHENGLAELLAQRAALDARISAAREREVKREPSPITLGPSNGEVIDLTIDD